MAAQYAPLGNAIIQQQPQQQTELQMTWWDRLVNAARIRFGPDIQLVESPAVTQNELTRFVDDLLLKVVHSDPEPSMVRSAIVDITHKEFVNLGERENDESIIQVGKNAPIAIGTRYHFIMTGSNIRFDNKYNFGAQIVTLSMTGGYLSVGGDILEHQGSGLQPGTNVQLQPRGKSHCSSEDKSEGQDRHFYEKVPAKLHPRVQHT